MNMLYRTIRRLMAASFLLAALILGAHSASAQAVFKQMNLEETVKKADCIMVAKCVEKESVYQNGNIVTRYRMKPLEVWKGRMKLNEAGEFSFEQMGGSISKPLPLTQTAPESVEMEPQQEVVMFTQAVDKQKVLSQAGADYKPKLSLDSPRLVSSRRGLMTIVRHPETGERLVVPGSVSPATDPKKLSALIASNQKRQVQADELNKAGAAEQKPKTREEAELKSGFPQATTVDAMRQKVEALAKPAS